MIVTHGVSLSLLGGIEVMSFWYASRCSTVLTANCISISAAFPAVSALKGSDMAVAM
jgi:hypothetical protein